MEKIQEEVHRQTGLEARAQRLQAREEAIAVRERAVVEREEGIRGFATLQLKQTAHSLLDVRTIYVVQEYPTDLVQALQSARGASAAARRVLNRRHNESSELLGHVHARQPDSVQKRRFRSHYGHYPQADHLKIQRHARLLTEPSELSPDSILT